MRLFQFFLSLAALSLAAVLIPHSADAQNRVAQAFKQNKNQKVTITFPFGSLNEPDGSLAHGVANAATQQALTDALGANGYSVLAEGTLTPSPVIAKCCSSFWELRFPDGTYGFIVGTRRGDSRVADFEYVPGSPSGGGSGGGADPGDGSDW